MAAGDVGRVDAHRGRLGTERVHDRELQLVLLWGVLVGVGTGSISMGFVATVSTRWFEARRGLVTGVLTAASATGQLIFCRSSPRCPRGMAGAGPR